jgi:hypothetical protein
MFGGCIMGMVDLPDYVGNVTGIPVTLDLYQNNTLVETVVGTLDENSMYIVVTNTMGPTTVVAKAPQWLSVREENINIEVITEVDVMFVCNGDADHDNAITLKDINTVFINFGEAGANDADVTGNGVVDLKDINLMFMNYGLVGA